MINLGDHNIEKLHARIEQLERQLAHYRATDGLGAGARYRALFDSMPQLVWATNQDGWHTYYNRRWYEFTGLSETESLGFGFANALHPDDKERTLTRWHKAWHDGESYEIEYRFRRHDGVYEWFIGRAMPVVAEDGRIVEWIGTCTNIDEQKRISEALSSFRNTLDRTHDCVFMFSPDDLKFFYVNQGAVDQVGYSKDELLTMTPLDIKPDYDEARFRALIRALIEGDEQVHTFITVHRHRDGHAIPVEIGLQYVPSEACFVAVVRDITDRMQAENRLRESEARYRALADAMPLLVWLATPDGKSFYYNQRYLHYTGLNKAELDMEGWSELIHPDDRAEAEVRWRASLANGFPYEMEFRLRRHDNEFRWMLVRAVAVRDEHHTISYWVGTNTIIDEQKRTEEMLRERSAELSHLTQALEIRNRELDQFAYVTSHDLKAPLRGIANLAGWIEEDLPDMPTPIKQHLDLMRGRVYRMEALIDGILQFSRVGRAKQEIELIDVRELLDDVIDLLAIPRHVMLTIDVDLPPLLTQKLLLQQVFANLIGNAVKHSLQDNLRISISAQPLPEHIEFRIADNGQGIAPKYHERIFGIFQTLASRDKIEGSGLGLALVKRIVEHQRGQVWVESAEGKGATFFFTWPYRVSEAGVAKHPRIQRDAGLVMQRQAPEIINKLGIPIKNTA
ncbi:PAS domain S-box protein [Candidatus Gracilibacteria bacterium]|nr:PAS domain S-box protein [Candidatus Gracilibacteria bacterium]